MSTEGVCGGDPPRVVGDGPRARVTGTTMELWELVAALQAGEDADAICARTGVTAAELRIAVEAWERDPAAFDGLV